MLNNYDFISKGKYYLKNVQYNINGAVPMFIPNGRYRVENRLLYNSEVILGIDYELLITSKILREW